ncbi:YihY/virulence factor BrkB family protein [Paractinoplanes rishiriensis]|uniref:Uncharacterized protein n=1 Tax=Paractinoplanes rishiriensis TaxID=1050105 RepID=A0A919JY01_9ACTN|nr:YhjD/YihY/BrkB family envelope integrity protein [Actinoplanes rishiriensis]GIE96945.1 hypothetical protein Ari01nite_44100 [Actinoplanes rishiriensis]
MLLAVPWAVLRKYLDDDGARHAALITYYGFLSMFPLLLLGVAVVSRVLVNNDDLRHRLVVAMVPPTLQETVDHAASALPTAPAALVVGVIGLLYSATGVVFAAYRTVNHVAAVPCRDLPGIFGAYLRVVGALLLLLAGVLAAGGLTVVGLGSWATAVVAFAVLLFGTRMLLVRPTALRALWPAAAAGALVLTLLLHVGAPLLARLVRAAGPVYGVFATVAGMFTLLYLLSQALVVIAEVTAVLGGRLWPRSFSLAKPREADVRALALLAREQERVPGQRVDSSFG